MKKEVSRLEIGIKSALRAIIPTFVVIYGLFQTGQLHSPKELFTAKGIMIILGALISKGVISAATAKSIEVKAAELDK